MSAPRKLTLILMHDDGKTHRMRMSRKFFLFLATLLILLPVLGGLGIWTGWEAWTAWQDFDQDRGQMQHELDDWRMRAERLSNIAKLAGLPLPPDDNQTPAMAASSTRNPIASVAESPRNMRASANATSPNASVIMPSANATSTAPAVATATQPAPLSDPPVASGSAGAEAEAIAPAESAPSNPREDEENNLDQQVVRLENVVSRVQTGRKLRITFDLYNAKPMAGQVGGNFSISLIDPDGKILPLEHDNGTFRISRFKKVAMQATLPDSVTATDNAALLITVIADDEPVLRKIYQVESR